MMAIRFIGGPLDGIDVPPEGGIPAPMPWAVYFACGCIEFVEDVLEPGQHQGQPPAAYYPLDEERTTPTILVYSLPGLASGTDELPRALDVPEPLVTA